MSHVNDVTKDLQYEEFFMKGRGIKKRLRIGAASVIDEVLMGRDMDYSGEDPHKEFMDNFGDHAGLKSSEKDDRPSRKPGYALASTMDTVIWGRDFDKSGAGTHEIFADIFSGSAGSRTEERPPDRPFRKGCYSMSSVMDNVIWGRDFDKSGEDPHQGFTKTYSGYAGVGAGNRPQRPFRKPAFSNDSVMTNVLTGRDAGAQLGDPHEKFMEQYGSHAGLKAAHKVFKPFRRPVMSMKSGADTVIWGRDVDMSGDNFHQGEHFVANFADHAGKMFCKGMPRSHQHKGEKIPNLNRSTSEPPPRSGGAQEAVQPTEQGPQGETSVSASHVSPEKKTPKPRKDKSSEAGGQLAFKPSSRSNSAGSLTARSNKSQPKSTGRSTSTGSLTSRSKQSASAGSLTARSKRSASAGSLTARSQQTLQSARSASVGSLTARPSPTSGVQVSRPALRKTPSCTGSAASTTSRDYGKGCWNPGSGSGSGSKKSDPAAASKPSAPSKPVVPSKPVASSASRGASAPVSKPRRSSSKESRTSRSTHTAQLLTARSHISNESGCATSRR